MASLLRPPNEFYQFTIDIATSALPKDEVATWIEAKAAPLEVEGHDDN